MPVTTARQKILAHLKKTRSASAREIGRALKMSTPNVRHHLGVLVSDGRVEMTSVNPRGGRGRPEKIFSLSIALLGDNLAVLVDALLMERPDVKDMAKRIAQSQDMMGDEKQPLAKRLVLLAEKLNAMQYQARWEAGAEGPRVIFGRCPYAKVIKKHPELCKMDTALLESSLGQAVIQFSRTDSVPHGLCPFGFRIG